MTASTKVSKAAGSPASTFDLLAMGHRAMGITAVELAARLGVASRTVGRWYARRSVDSFTLARLAPHVHPYHPELAARMHAHATEELAEVGLRPPPLPAPKSDTARERDPVDAIVRADAVVHAACKAVDASPRAIAPALLAAFRRARELGLTVEDMERELSPPSASKKAGKQE